MSTVTKKSNRALIALVCLSLLLGLGIQVGLALQRQARQHRESRALCQRLLSQAGELGRARLAPMELDRYELAALAAQKGSAHRALHLELLVLVNPWNPLPEDYQVELKDVATWQEGQRQRIDRRCADALMAMIADCAAAGYRPYICSSYRTQAMQEELFANKLARVREEGWPWDEAPAIAAQAVALPGTSEHQLGLAADIIDEDYSYLDQGQERTGTQRWLMENSWRYGFILRYPNGTTDITGIIYEPWHYRYVGEDFAREIHELGITLEEYIALRRGR